MSVQDTLLYQLSNNGTSFEPNIFTKKDFVYLLTLSPKPNPKTVSII